MRLCRRVEQVVAVTNTKVRHLRRFACARTNVTRLGGDGAKTLKEPIAHVFHDAHRTTAAIVQDGGAARLGPNPQHRFGHFVQRLVPADFMPMITPPPQGPSESVGGILAFQKTTGPMAQKALSDRMVGSSAQASHPSGLDRCQDFARIGAIAIAGRSPNRYVGHLVVFRIAA